MDCILGNQKFRQFVYDFRSMTLLTCCSIGNPLSCRVNRSRMEGAATAFFQSSWFQMIQKRIRLCRNPPWQISSQLCILGTFPVTMMTGFSFILYSPCLFQFLCNVLFWQEQNVQISFDGIVLFRLPLGGGVLRVQSTLPRSQLRQLRFQIFSNRKGDSPQPFQLPSSSLESVLRKQCVLRAY